MRVSVVWDYIGALALNSQSFSNPSFSSHANFSLSLSSPAISTHAMLSVIVQSCTFQSVIVQSCYFHPCDVVRHCPVSKGISIRRCLTKKSQSACKFQSPAWATMQICGFTTLGFRSKSSWSKVLKSTVVEFNFGELRLLYNKGDMNV